MLVHTKKGKEINEYKVKGSSLIILFGMISHYFFIHLNIIFIRIF